MAGGYIRDAGRRDNDSPAARIRVATEPDFPRREGPALPGAAANAEVCRDVVS
jgi:hypothetical protein